MKTARKSATKVRKTKKVAKRKVTKVRAKTKKVAAKRKPSKAKATKRVVKRPARKAKVARRKATVLKNRPRREKLPTWKIKSYNRNQKKWWTLTYFRENDFLKMMEYLLSIRCNFQAYSPTGEKLASCGV